MLNHVFVIIISSSSININAETFLQMKQGAALAKARVWGWEGGLLDHLSPTTHLPSP